MSFEELLEGWEGEQTVVRHDPESGAWMFVCIHSTVRGPAGGGTRMRTYATPAEGLADAMALSRAMTMKFAVLDAPRGGGKAVLAVPALPQGEARRRLLLRYGELVASLRGTYRTAGDMNITPEDLAVVAERCEWVYGVKGGDSGYGTARGVFHGIRASVEHAFGSGELRGRSVLVQGAGAVGRPLVEFLREAGAIVLVSDVDASRAGRLDATFVPADEAAGAECDVLAPCAVGGTIDAEAIGRLRCRIVAGSANNQLGEPADAERLAARGILYAPDYVINGGGVLQLLGIEDWGWDAERLERAYTSIGDTLREIYRAADRDGVSTAAAAERLALSRL